MLQVIQVTNPQYTRTTHAASTQAELHAPQCPCAFALDCNGGRDNQPQDKAGDATGCSQRKLCYLLPEARQNLADILNRLDLL